MNSQATSTTVNNRIHAFAKAGHLLSLYLNKRNNASSEAYSKWDLRIAETIQKAEIHNSWFTQDNLIFCLESWSKLLTIENLNNWLSRYILVDKDPKTIAVIAAGNIPLVGFHDVLAVLLTGNHALIKTSKNDELLLPLLLEMAQESVPELTQGYTLTTGILPAYDAVIATGSNNTARYFEHYFGKKPNIIRHNRNSIAILTGQESPQEMERLSDDVFQYFGLGCRSVSHLKIPRDYDFDLFFNGMYNKRELINMVKYTNNYDYNKAVYLMSQFNLLDNEFLILKEETSSYASPIASLGFSYYDDLNVLMAEIKSQASNLQCVVAGNALQAQLNEALRGLAAPDVCDFGKTQQPSLKDYADGIDVVEFLLTLS